MAKEGNCYFCGRPLGAYESKMIEKPPGDRMVCILSENGGRWGNGCFMREFKSLSNEEQGKFESFTDG